MLVLNAEVLFVDSLVFLHVVSVVRGRSSRVEGGMRGWSSPGRLGSGGRKRRGGPTVDGDCLPQRRLHPR